MAPGTFANDECLLTNSSGAYGVTISEHIIAVSLMMMRMLTLTFEETLNGKWGKPKPQKSLKNCRITALGTGDIGSCFAKRVKAFEPSVLIGVNRSGKTADPSFDKIIKIDELDNILPEGAYIVNVGRGTAIDEDALADMLDSGHIAGAALDVFQTEPLPEDSRLWKTKIFL